jgi:hypothetical protein
MPDKEDAPKQPACANCGTAPSTGGLRCTNCGRSLSKRQFGRRDRQSRRQNGHATVVSAQASSSAFATTPTIEERSRGSSFDPEHLGVTRKQRRIARTWGSRSPFVWLAIAAGLAWYGGLQLSHASAHHTINPGATTMAVIGGLWCGLLSWRAIQPARKAAFLGSVKRVVHAVWHVLIRVTVVVMTVSTVILIYIWITGNWKHGANKALIDVCAWGLGGPVLAAIGFGFIYILIGLLYSINRNINVAMQPVPSPAEIEWQLRQQGYNPTLADVAAVQQMCIARRNEAALGAAVGLGALYVAGRTANGKPIL